MGIKITKLGLNGVFVIEPDYFYDERGYYSETFSERSLSDHSFIAPRFVQDGESLSIKKGIVRGIHFQLVPKAQSKLVRCIQGRVFDVAVDLRKKSPTYKQWIGVELSPENKKQLFIPKGFGHAFMTLVDDCIVQYKVDELYYKEFDRSIRFDDPEIGIKWPLANPLKSEKDRLAPSLKESDVNF
ncbi:MAG: dTDP-4-dehydrorhamnose 3,5-epimerase [Bacilli bacterium]|jgi:dTDP-4-dehydrorhamnose 3,5-epimerase